MTTNTIGSSPQRVAVVGAGMVGLATAWFLQNDGVEVTVYERERVAAGSSWGNAGWLTPGLAAPLPEPAVLRYGVRAVLSPSSPVYVPLRYDPRLLRFLAGFLRRCTMPAWRRGMEAMLELDRQAFDAFDELAAGGVDEPTVHAPNLACFRTEAEREPLLAEIGHIAELGLRIPHESLSGDATRAMEPLLSEEVRAGLVFTDERYVNPGRYVDAVASAVRKRGGDLREGVSVRALRDDGRQAVVVDARGHREEYDAVVVATGAWLNALTKEYGVRTVVQAGRGYSFSVPVDRAPASTVYLPAARVACTPLGDRMRVAGMMEFRAPDRPLDERRIRAIVAASRPFFAGADFDRVDDEWVGSRPCTPDGLPLIGSTWSSRVFVAGGHGMWGITLGPVTGKLVARQVVSGRRPDLLAAFDPTR